METWEGISDRHVLKRGVPQAGVVSPLLFSIAPISLDKTVEKKKGYCCTLIYVHRHQDTTGREFILS